MVIILSNKVPRFGLNLRSLTKSVYTSNAKCTNGKFVPKHQPLLEGDWCKIRDLILNRDNISVITGAGVSTESGIPDYRSEGVGLYSTSNHTPIRHQTFVSNEKARKRYWIRNYVGWPYFSSTQPNETHFRLSEWQKAGSERVIELHGSSYTVKCINCGHHLPRTLFQKILSELNPEVKIFSTEIRPDGDTYIDEDLAINFKVPDCSRCNGLLKPDVVFFGDNVPRTKVDRIREIVLSSDALLILGSSLEVYSGYRFVLTAYEAGIPVAIINIGKTRADNMASVKVEAKCSEVLSQIYL